MGRMAYATRGWKKLQAAYSRENLSAVYRQKLCALLLRGISGLSYEETVIHYSSLSFLALYCAVSAYMQTGGLSQAECWLCLSAQARMAANAILPRNPRWAPGALSALPMEDLSAALLCGQSAAALDVLRMVPITLERERLPLWNGRPDRRVDQKQAQRRKRRLTLESGLYESLLRGGGDAQSRQLLAELDCLGWNPISCKALHALLEGDGAGFTEALTLHMKDFRAAPEAGELNNTVLFWEALWQRRGGEPPLDLSDAPAALLGLPPCDPARLAEDLGLSLPSFETEEVLRHVDTSKVGPAFVPLYSRSP